MGVGLGLGFDGAALAAALGEDVKGDEVARQAGVRNRVAREAPLAEEDLVLRCKQLAECPRMLVEPRVEALELR